MSGDLEDFLRRAAQRRQAKAAQQKQTPQQPSPRPRPQYSDRQSERVVDAVIVDEPIAAEFVDDPNSLAARQKRLAESREAAAQAEAETAKVHSGGRRSSQTVAGSMSYSGVPAHDLLQLLARPGGIAQAFLLREILDRPEHRW